MTEATEPKGGIPTVWRIVGGALLVIFVIVAMGLLVQHDLSGEGLDADASVGELLQRYGYLGGFGLIYIEESGVPLFIPGDAFLVYVGDRLPHNVPVLMAAWIGFVLAVIFGSTNLYLLSRRFGRRLLEHRLARFLDLTPARIDSAERWFRRYGPWALIFGRHIPGFRVPLTVAAGILELPYRIFVISVAVSSSAWAGTFLLLGVVFGRSIERSIRSSPFIYVGAVGAVIVVVAVAVVARLRQRAPETRRN
ncbi:MAG TPA: DedA family protein [Candidatus Dormibacteraeota bacterium]|nr:DedA family protein [Candidatus Dormibacteraeota bacterium]